MSKTKVISIRSGKCYDANGKWRKGYVYIGRRNKSWKLLGSVWANPFKVSDYKNPEQCLADYRNRFEGLLDLPGSEYERQRTQWRNELKKLKGKILVCWCKNKGDEPCHGDVLVELIEKYFPPEGESEE